MTSPRLTVMVCHDCCCGTVRKHPDVDHRAHLDDLLACRSSSVRVKEVLCLDECDRSNVVLLRDHTRDRRTRDTWLGGLNTSEAMARLVTWIRDGGELPDEVRRHRFSRRRPPPSSAR